MLLLLLVGLSFPWAVFDALGAISRLMGVVISVAHDPDHFVPRAHKPLMETITGCASCFAFLHHTPCTLSYVRPNIGRFYFCLQQKACCVSVVPLLPSSPPKSLPSFYLSIITCFLSTSRTITICFVCSTCYMPVFGALRNYFHSQSWLTTFPSGSYLTAYMVRH